VPAYWNFPDDYKFRLDVSAPLTKHDLSLRYLFKYYKFRVAVPPTDMRMTAGPLMPGIQYAQSFVAQKGNLMQIEVEFATYTASIGAGLLQMHLRRALDAREDIASRTIPLHTIEDNAFVGLQFPPIPDSHGKTYYIVFETRDYSQPITVWLSSRDVDPQGSFFVNGQARPQNTYFRAFYATGAP